MRGCYLLSLPTYVLCALCSITEFIFLTQCAFHYEETLHVLNEALQEFHHCKSSILAAGGQQGKNGPLDHFQIPKLELAHHVVQSTVLVQWVPPTNGPVTSQRGAISCMPKHPTTSPITTVFINSAATSLINKKCYDSSAFLPVSKQLGLPLSMKSYMRKVWCNSTHWIHCRALIS